MLGWDWFLPEILMVLCDNLIHRKSINIRITISDFIEISTMFIGTSVVGQISIS